MTAIPVSNYGFVSVGMAVLFWRPYSLWWGMASLLPSAITSPSVSPLSFVWTFVSSFYISDRWLCVLNLLLTSSVPFFLTVYSHEELLASYKGNIYLTYCGVLLFIVAVHHLIYRFVFGFIMSIADGSFYLFLSELIVLWAHDRRGREVATLRGEEPVGAWRMLLPYSYAVVSGAIGSHSVLFAKSL